MNLRFEIDQAECFRRGINTPKSIVTIDVDPANLDPTERGMIADRLNGIDVYKLALDGIGQRYNSLLRIKANTPDYAGLIEAIWANESELAV